MARHSSHVADYLDLYDDDVPMEDALSLEEGEVPDSDSEESIPPVQRRGKRILSDDEDSDEDSRRAWLPSTARNDLLESDRRSRKLATRENQRDRSRSLHRPPTTTQWVPFESQEPPIHARGKLVHRHTSNPSSPKQSNSFAPRQSKPSSERLSKPSTTRYRHVYQHALASTVLVVDGKTGSYTLTNGTTSVSVDGDLVRWKQRLLADFCWLKSDRLYVLDEESRDAWNEAVEALGTTYSGRRVKWVRPFLLHPCELDQRPCMYCKKLDCHRKRAVDGIRRLLQVRVEEIRHR